MRIKSLIFLFSVIALVALACHKKAAPTVTDRTVQPAPPVATNPPVAATAGYNAEDITAGKTVYETRCGKCHGLKKVDDYTVERWPGILKSMIPKSKLDEMQAKQVTAYVMTNAKKS